MAKRNILLLVANTGHARILRREHLSGELHTWVRIDNGPGSRRPHAPLETDHRPERMAAFVEVIAAHLREALHQHPVDGVLLAAPARFGGVLKTAVEDCCPVIAVVAKDLVKVPDHELAERLAPELAHADHALA